MVFVMVFDGKLVLFHSKDGFALDGFLKKNKNNNKKIVIFVHGMGGENYRFPFCHELLKTFNNSKYDFFLMHNRGQQLAGKIYGKKKKKLAGTAYEKFEECVYDIEGAIKELEKMDYKKFVLAGHSTGCQKVTYYQSKKKDRRVEGIVLLSPCDDHNLKKIKKNYEKNLRIAKKMVREGNGNKLLPKEISNFSARRYLSFADPKNVEAKLFNYNGRMFHFSKIKEPFFVLFGENDIFAEKKAEDCFEKMRKISKSKKLETCIVPKADHCYFGKEKIVAKKIKEYLEKN